MTDTPEPIPPQTPPVGAAGSPEQDATPKLEATDLYACGSMTERANLLMGMLTNAATGSLIYASGDFPELNEQGFSERKAEAARMYGRGGSPSPSKFSGTVTHFLAARSANLRDAARVSDAVARLMNTYLNTRKAAAGHSTVIAEDWQEGDKHGRRLRTVKRMPLSLDDIAATPVPPELGTESAPA
ncbi:MAG TPA: hypothetical protein VG387_17130 [Rhizomicrobium sp.]|jgi:hypothetical protein|nr:hypothetical protein [Rhizomicrobium sp.]